MKLSRYITIGAILYFVLLLIDFFTTLFPIDESGVYHTKLGIKLTMDMSPEELFTTFALTPKILVTFVVWIAIVLAFYVVIYQVRKRRG